MLRTKASLSVDSQTPSPIQTIVRRRHEAGAYTGPLAPVREQASLTCFFTSLAQAMPCLIGTQVHRMERARL